MGRRDGSVNYKKKKNDRTGSQVGVILLPARGGRRGFTLHLPRGGRAFPRGQGQSGSQRESQVAPGLPGEVTLLVLL